MKTLPRVAYFVLGIGMMGCPAGAPSNFQNSAGEVDDTLAALTADDPNAVLDALEQMSKDSEASDASSESAQSTSKDGSDGGVEADADGASSEHRDGGGDHRGPRPQGRGHGEGLLVWYADLAALKVCQDLRATCATSADPSGCEQQVKDCVRPVLQAAFKAMCDERVAECDSSGGKEKACDHIREACSSGEQDGAEKAGSSKQGEQEKSGSAEAKTGEQVDSEKSTSGGEAKAGGEEPKADGEEPKAAGEEADKVDAGQPSGEQPSAQGDSSESEMATPEAPESDNMADGEKSGESGG